MFIAFLFIFTRSEEDIKLTFDPFLKLAVALNDSLSFVLGIISEQVSLPAFIPSALPIAQSMGKGPLDLLEAIGLNKMSLIKYGNLASSISEGSTLTEIIVNLMNIAGITMTVDSYKLVMPTVIQTLRFNDNFYKITNFNKTVVNYVLYDYSNNVLTYTLGNLTDFLGVSLTPKFYQSMKFIGETFKENSNVDIPTFLITMGYPDTKNLQATLKYIQDILSGPINLELISQWQTQVFPFIDNVVNMAIGDIYMFIEGIMPLCKSFFTMNAETYVQRIEALEGLAKDILYNADYSFLQIFLSPKILSSITELTPTLKKGIPLFMFFQDNLQSFDSFSFLFNKESPLYISIIRLLPNGSDIMEIMKILANQTADISEVLPYLGNILNITELQSIFAQTVGGVLSSNVPITTLTVLKFIPNANILVSILTLAKNIAAALLIPENIQYPINSVLANFDQYFAQFGLSTEKIKQMSLGLIALSANNNIVESLDTKYNTKIRSLAGLISQASVVFAQKANEKNIILSSHITTLISNIGNLAVSSTTTLGNIFDVFWLYGGGDVLYGSVSSLIKGIALNSKIVDIITEASTKDSVPLKYTESFTSMAAWNLETLSFSNLMNTFVFKVEDVKNTLPLHMIYTICTLFKDPVLVPNFYTNLLKLDAANVMMQLGNLMLNRLIPSPSLEVMATQVTKQNQEQMFTMLSTACALTAGQQIVPANGIAVMLSMMSAKAQSIKPASVPEIPPIPAATPTKKTLSRGAVAGIAVAVIVVAIALLVITVKMTKRKTKRSAKAAAEEA